MNFKKWWKKLDYWKKGGIIGAITYSIYYLIIFTLLFNLNINIPYFFIQAILVTPLLPIFYIASNICGFEGYGEGLLCDNIIFQTIFYFIIFVILGYIIGIVVSLFSRKKKK